MNGFSYDIVETHKMVCVNLNLKRRCYRKGMENQLTFYITKSNKYFLCLIIHLQKKYWCYQKDSYVAMNMKRLAEGMPHLEKK